MALVAMHWANRRKLRGILRGRRLLSEVEFAALFAVPLEGTVAQSVRTLLAPWVPCDVSLLRPDDEFCGDLFLDALDGMDPEEFLLSVEKMWDVDIPRVEAAELKTIAQLAAAVAVRLGGSQSSMRVNADVLDRSAAQPPADLGRRLPSR